MTDVFISYKREERPEAQAIAEVIASRGYDVWWDVDLLPGDKFADEIETIIHQAKVAIVLWSEKSVKSDFVRAEAHLALTQKTLIPARLDDANIPLPFGSLHTLDLKDWDGHSITPNIEALLDTIAKRTGLQPAKTVDLSATKTKLDWHVQEADYWKAIDSTRSQSADEYRAYLERFGNRGTFSDLARIRIQKLQSQRKRSWPKVTSILAGSTAFIGLIAGGLELADRLGVKLPNAQETDSPISVELEEKTVALVGTKIGDASRSQTQRPAAGPQPSNTTPAITPPITARNTPSMTGSIAAPAPAPAPGTASGGPSATVSVTPPITATPPGTAMPPIATTPPGTGTQPPPVETAALTASPDDDDTVSDAPPDGFTQAQVAFASVRGEGVVEVARRVLGQPHAGGGKADLTNANWNGGFHATDLVGWAIYQATGRLIGCRPKRKASTAICSLRYWDEEEFEYGIRKTSPQAALAVSGAILISLPDGSDQPGDIAISVGDRRRAIDAVDEDAGVRIASATEGRDWDFGVILFNLPEPDLADDTLTLARLIYSEAGQSSQTMAALANVILNRVADPRYPDTVNDVAFQPQQFYPLSRRNPNRGKLLAMLPGSSEKFDRAYDIAHKTLSGELEDATRGALYYHASRFSPRWSRTIAAKHKIQIGNLVFYSFYRQNT
jgi:TIR domain/Cell Wall Hydrolase